MNIIICSDSIDYSDTIDYNTIDYDTIDYNDAINGIDTIVSAEFLKMSQLEFC